MLETFGRSSPRVVIVDSSTMTISAGDARVGNTFVHYDGTKATFNETASFSGATGYRNALLFLQNDGITTDMTRSLSDTTGSVTVLQNPVMATSGYASGYPVGMFTFYSTDGTNATLMSYRVS